MNWKCSYPQQARHDVAKTCYDCLLIWRMLRNLGQHFDGRLVDGEVARFHDWIENSDHNVGRKYSGHGCRTRFSCSLNLKWHKLWRMNQWDIIFKCLRLFLCRGEPPALSEWWALWSPGSSRSAAPAWAFRWGRQRQALVLCQHCRISFPGAASKHP